MVSVPRQSDTRERVLDVSAQIFRRQGYAATALKQIVSEGRAPIGSLYHFFPGGKQQVGLEALTRSGEGFGRLIDHVFERSSDTPAAAIAWFALAADALEQSDYADGCPIGTVASEVASSNDALRLVCAEAFEAWMAKIRIALIRDGVSPADAKALAVFGLSALEGAFILSRVTRSTQPLENSGQLVAAAIQGAIRSGQPRASSPTA